MRFLSLLLLTLLLLHGTPAVSAQPTASALRTQLGELGREIRALGEKIRALEKERTAIRRQSAARRQQLTRQREQMRTLMRLAHQLGPGANLQNLLGHTRPGQRSRFRVYHEQFGRARSEQIAAFRTNLQTLDAAAKKNQALENSLVKARSISLEKKATLEKRLQELLQRAEETPAAAQAAPFAAMRGQLNWPLPAAPVNRFGDQRASGRLRWRGVILPAAEGSPVRAIHPGQVVFADWFGERGLLLVLNHGGGYMSLYGSNSSLLYAVDSDIDTGAIIATAGHSGDREEDGLYFEIRYRGQPVDPALWCR